jgi:hypothetical protein
LISIKWEFAVAGNQGDAVADGMGDYKVIAWVIMFLRLVDLKTGVGFVMLLMEIKYPETIHILY